MQNPIVLDSESNIMKLLITKFVINIMIFGLDLGCLCFEKNKNIYLEFHRVETRLFKASVLEKLIDTSYICAYT